MKRSLATLVFFVFTQLSYAQTTQKTQIESFAIQIAKAEYAAFTKVGTEVKLWVNTGQNNFIKILDKTKLNLISLPQKVDVFELGDSVKKAYDEESARLAQKGKMRFSTRMQSGSGISGAEEARDTTGFVIVLKSLASPPIGTTKLQVKGKISYLTTNQDTTILELDIANLKEHAYSYQSLTYQGLTIEFRQTGVRAYGTDYEYKATIDDKTFVVGYSQDGEEFKSTIMLPNEVTEKPIKIFLKVVGTQEKTIAVDTTFGLGL